MKSKRYFLKNKALERLEWIETGIDSLKKLLLKGEKTAAVKVKDEIMRELASLEEDLSTEQKNESSKKNPRKLYFPKKFLSFRSAAQFLILLFIFLQLGASLHLFWEAYVQTRSGLMGHYFRGTKLKGLVLKRQDPNINFQWFEEPPAQGLPKNHFSVRWTGFIKIPRDGMYNFTTYADDGVRLKIGERKIIDNWRNQKPTTKSGQAVFKKGVHPIEIDYFDGRKDAVIQLFWDKGKIGEKEIIPKSQFIPKKEYL